MDPQDFETLRNEIEATVVRAHRLTNLAISVGIARDRWQLTKANFRGPMVPGDMLPLKGAHMLGLMNTLPLYLGPLEGPSSFFRDEPLLATLRRIKSGLQTQNPKTSFSDTVELPALEGIAGTLGLLADSQDVFLTDRAVAAARSNVRSLKVSAGHVDGTPHAVFPERDVVLFGANQQPEGGLESEIAVFMQAYVGLARDAIAMGGKFHPDQLCLTASGMVTDGASFGPTSPVLLLLSLRTLDAFEAPALMRSSLPIELDDSPTSALIDSLLMVASSKQFEQINKVEIDQEYLSRYGVAKQYRNHAEFDAGYDRGELGGGRVVDFTPGLPLDLA